jgi:hypothetical protein
MKVRYLGDEKVSDAVVNWGGNDDPRGLLIKDKEYELLEQDVHSWHTKYILAEFPNKRFNSVSFE